MNDQSLENLKLACRDRGLPLTAQRRIVFESLVGRHDHPTADQIYDQVRDSLPDLSRATVYRVLSTLVEWGLAQKVSCTDRGARFDGKIDNHHHLVCRSCDAIVDTEADFPIPSRRPKGFRIEGTSVVFHGICSDCSEKK